MEVDCPIDTQFAAQISSLLQPPPPNQVQDYFDKLLATKQCRGLRIKQTGDHGKGVYADIKFEEGDLVLKDQILVGAQHSSNKIDCLVCSFCFRFIGSVELQIGRKLYSQDLGDSVNGEFDRTIFSHKSKDCMNLDSSDSDDNPAIEDGRDMGECSSSSSKNKIPLHKEAVESLMSGEIALPYSKKFLLPSVTSCCGGCSEVYYCSKSCAEADWDLFHSLLCTGEGSKSLSKEALSKFVQHANETNDIFLLAAKAISSTILKYMKLKASFKKEREENGGADVSGKCNFALLLEAWKPISMGYKKSNSDIFHHFRRSKKLSFFSREYDGMKQNGSLNCLRFFVMKQRWWDCIALPEDVDYCDEAAFRIQIKQLAFESLQLLKEAIFVKECAPLFSLEIYGHIIGMFELNNLDLVVASPVEDYFLFIEDLPEAEKEKIDKITRPVLDALGEDYSIFCQGSAFYPLQSCLNHSCHPNAKAFKREEDRDGQATIIACRPISKGEEVTISYIEEDLPYEDRKAALADYGFICRCSKCLKEEP